MLAPVIALVVAAAPAPIKLAAPGFDCVNLEANVCALHTATFAQLLAERGVVRVTTQREIATLLGMERQRQLLGCSAESETCMGELAGALGVDGVVTGSIGKLGSAYTVNVKIVSARDGSSLASKSGRVKDDDELHAWFVETAREFSETLTPRSSAAPGGLRGMAWIPLAGGGLAVGAGALLIALGNGDARTIREASPSEPQDFGQLTTLRNAGEAKQAAGVTAIAVGAAAVLVGAGFLVFGAPGEPAVSLQVGPGSVGLAMSWELP